MILYRIVINNYEQNCYATAKHLRAAKRHLLDGGAEICAVERIEFELSKRGIIAALREGGEGAGGALDGQLTIYAGGELT